MERKARFMYCPNCGKKLENGEVCYCKVSLETAEASQAFEATDHFYPESRRVKSTRKERAKKALAGIIIVTAIFLVAFVFWDMADVKLNRGDITSKVEKVTDNIIYDAIENEFVLESTDVEYTKGEINGNIYTNEWANIKIEFDERFENAPQEYYDPYENLLSDCGAYFIAEEDGDEIGITFYKAGTHSVKEYCDETIDSWMDALENHFEDVFSQEYIDEIVYTKDAKSVDIAGEEYLGVFLTVGFQNGLSPVYSDYCAEKNRKIIDIVVISDSVEESLDLVGDFEPLK